VAQRVPCVHVEARCAGALIASEGFSRNERLSTGTERDLQLVCRLAVAKLPWCGHGNFALRDDGCVEERGPNRVEAASDIGPVRKLSHLYLIHERGRVGNNTIRSASAVPGRVTVRPRPEAAPDSSLASIGSEE
jgi:hypothetical protein